MKTTAKVYWLVFGVFQIVGFVLFALDGPFFPAVLRIVGWGLLLPGTLAALGFAEMGVGVDISLATVLGGVLLANFGAWYVARRIWLAARSRVRTEK